MCSAMPESVDQDVSRPILAQRSVDSVRPLKVIVIGAGVSGILAAIRLPQRLKDLELVVYDKNEEIGGTWFENRYPGVACGKEFLMRISLYGRMME